MQTKINVIAKEADAKTIVFINTFRCTIFKFCLCHSSDNFRANNAVINNEIRLVNSMKHKNTSIVKITERKKNFMMRIRINQNVMQMYMQQPHGPSDGSTKYR